MATLTVQDVNRTSVEPTYAACAGGGDVFPNDGKTILHFKNASVGDITVTFAVQQLVDGQTPAGKTCVVVASKEKMVGPFPPSIYNNSSGQVAMTYSGVTTFTVAALRIGE